MMPEFPSFSDTELAVRRVTPPAKNESIRSLATPATKDERSLKPSSVQQSEEGLALVDTGIDEPYIDHDSDTQIKTIDSDRGQDLNSKEGYQHPDIPEVIRIGITSDPRRDERDQSGRFCEALYRSLSTAVSTPSEGGGVRVKRSSGIEAILYPDGTYECFLLYKDKEILNLPVTLGRLYPTSAEEAGVLLALDTSIFNHQNTLLSRTNSFEILPTDGRASIRVVGATAMKIFNDLKKKNGNRWEVVSRKKENYYLVRGRNVTCIFAPKDKSSKGLREQKKAPRYYRCGISADPVSGEVFDL